MPHLAPHIAACFADLVDPRVERTTHHQLLDIVTIALCAVISGAETCVEIEQWGRAKEDWLTEWLGLGGRRVLDHGLNNPGRVSACMRARRYLLPGPGDDDRSTPDTATLIAPSRTPRGRAAKVRAATTRARCPTYSACPPRLLPARVMAHPRTPGAHPRPAPALSRRRGAADREGYARDCWAGPRGVSRSRT
jgi:hypothetical protein